MAHKGLDSEAKITQELPPAIMLQICVTNPNKPLFSGAKAATIPVGSGTEKLK